MLLVHEAGHAADGSALAGGVAALEQHDHPHVGSFEVALELEQLDLPGPQLGFGLSGTDARLVLAAQPVDLPTRAEVATGQLRSRQLLALDRDEPVGLGLTGPLRGKGRHACCACR